MPDTARLHIDLSDHQRLFDIFGEDAAGQALRDFNAACSTLVDRLLARHIILERQCDEHNCSWNVRFRLAEPPADRGEILSSLGQVGQTLLREALNGIFGNASGMRIPARLHILPGNIASVPEAEPLSSADADEVERILADENLRTVLQPIVRLQDRQLLGFEALSRGPLGSTLERPDRLFAAAGAAGLSVSAELICARLALERTRGRLNHGQFLTINLGPAALLRAANVLPLAGRTDVVFELTEHLPLDAAAELRSAIDRLHQLQLHTALDDTGCGFADLRTAEILRPGIVKLCITVIRNADRGDPFIHAIKQTTQQLQALGCRVLAEGVETESQHAALVACGIELGQGWLYGRPLDLERALNGN